MAEEKNTNVEEVTAETTAVEVPQPDEAQANPEQFLKDFALISIIASRSEICITTPSTT